MRLAIVGGKLQGVEAAYLAAKAGYQTVLVDRRQAPPAAGLADRHVVMDVTADAERSRTVLAACDAVLPACEDEATLAWLADHVPGWDVPLLFDPEAYAVSSSKLASNALFARLGVPRPRPRTEGGYPLVVKPSVASGSHGVHVVRNAGELRAARADLEESGHEVVVEEYVAGPSLSLEVLCWAGRAVPLQVTGLEFDEVYDCKRVVAPVGEGARPDATPFDWTRAVARGVLAAFDAATTSLAEGLRLRGLMDVEVIVHDRIPKVLEIDARLPSQTPTAVYWSSGLNVVDLLSATFRDGRVPPVDRTAKRACVFEHVHAARGRLAVAGEHVIGVARPLRLVPGFFGADEALTDYAPGRDTWAATLITLGETVSEARHAADAAVVALASEEHLHLLPEGKSES